MFRGLPTDGLLSQTASHRSIPLRILHINIWRKTYEKDNFKNGNSKEELEEMALIVGKLIGKKEGSNAENIVIITLYRKH